MPVSRVIRPAAHRRSWLFVPGADEAALSAVAGCGADVLIQEMEDLVPEPLRPRARAISPEVLARWRDAGTVATVRINPLASGGLDDLAAAMPGRPDAVLMAMVSAPEQIRALDEAIARHESRLGLPVGSTEIVPNIETAAGLLRTREIAAASTRVTAALVAAEDMAADLGAERTPDCRELAHVRSHFLVQCVAAGIVAIDCPYTFSNLDDAERDLHWARGLGYRAKSIVNVDQVGLVNRLLTPSVQQIAHARRIVESFDAARALGRDRVDVDGLMVEVPTYRAARRLLERAAQLAD